MYFLRGGWPGAPRFLSASLSSELYSPNIIDCCRGLIVTAELNGIQVYGDARALVLARYLKKRFQTRGVDASFQTIADGGYVQV